MSNLGLNIGLQGLLTSQSLLDTIGHNLTNASTPGYSRQNLLIAANPAQHIYNLVQGGGVHAGVVQRTVDQLLERRMGEQRSSLGRLDARLYGLDQLESLLGGGSSSNIGTLLSAMSDRLSSLAAAPEDGLLRGGVVLAASELASRMQSVARGTEALRQDTLGHIKSAVDDVNVLAARIGELNREITVTEAGQRSANDLRDQRDLAIAELSKLVDLRTIEEPNGGVRVLVAGQTLVSPSSVKRLTVDTISGTEVALRLEDGAAVAPITGGAIGGLMGLLRETVPSVAGEVNALAHQLILELNRAHSTGVPTGGPFDVLSGTNVLVDQDGDGLVADELVARAGLPFDVSSGELFVNVTDRATGERTQHRIAIDHQRTTVGDLLGELNAIAGLDASVDAEGHLEITGEVGFGFDFSPRLDTHPDAIGSFGGAHASLSTARGPFTLAHGDTLDFTTATGPVSVTFDAASFAQIGAATAEEIAAVLQNDANFAASGLTASAVGDRLVVQTAATGASASYTVSGGSALGALGWSAGTTVAGQDLATSVEISGSYSGAANATWTFRALSDGTIGSTAGLQVEVLDQRGSLVAVLDVGAGYQPGEPIEIANGVEVTFGVGAISASDGDVFELHVVADADTCDLLPALGLNGLFTGSDASDIAVRADLEGDPDLLAISNQSEVGDNSAVQAMLATLETGVAGLSDRAFGEHFSRVAGDVGFALDSARTARDSEQLVQDSLAARRAQISGVNTDEELVNMIRQQQAYAAASQYIRVVSELTRDLINIV
jgi:flagellar hook-associated protein FlgK